MNFKDLKYLTAYAVPGCAAVGLVLQSMWLWLTPLVIFGLVPIVELAVANPPVNLDEEQRSSKLASKFFDLLLWLNLPIVFGMVAWGLYVATTADLTGGQLTGLILSIGIVAGSNGINVAHELGHRHNWERYIGKALLMPSLYMHFFIEHNYGHHLNAATIEDPATARYNQSLYHFWFTSVTRQYAGAWKIQKRLNGVNNTAGLSFNNDMLWYTVLQLLYLAAITAVFGISGLLVALGIALTGALLLETINYIEHYGLRRSKTKTGRYERVREIHSWNSNHVLGRVLLYELTRHSDHHYKSDKKYQVLDYHDVSPQLPFGYPTSMVLATVPPLWFAVMNKHVPSDMKLAHG